MKKTFTILALILSITAIVADGEIVVYLREGRNNITITEEFESTYASDLVKRYPQIESISVSEYGNTYGYINTMGGIGLDILIQPNKEYEIFSKDNVTVIIEN
jgi:hypothetical protein